MNQQQRTIKDKNTFYGLPYRLEEPPEHSAASATARQPIVAVEEEDESEDITSHVEEGDEEEVGDEEETIQAMNRNARRPKGPNRGKRAVSRIARREKKRAIGNHRR